MVNEFLTAMEAFTGLLVATSNRMTAMDPASIRRFDGKIRLDWLTPEQVRKMIRAGWAELGSGEMGDEITVHWHKFDRLTPGDIAAAMRRVRYDNARSFPALYAALEQECKTKDRVPARIGFI